MCTVAGRECEAWEVWLCCGQHNRGHTPAQWVDGQLGGLLQGAAAAPPAEPGQRQPAVGHGREADGQSGAAVRGRGGVWNNHIWLSLYNSFAMAAALAFVTPSEGPCPLEAHAEQICFAAQNLGCHTVTVFISKSNCSRTEACAPSGKLLSVSMSEAVTPRDPRHGTKSCAGQLMIGPAASRVVSLEPVVVADAAGV